MNSLPPPTEFVVTKEHRRFVEFCEACRRYRYIGLCYGPPGVGKTVLARIHAKWDTIEHLLNNCRLMALPAAPEILDCDTVFYTPHVANSPRRLEKEVAEAREQFNNLLKWMQGILEGKDVYELPFETPDAIDLIIVDETDRLKTAGLEQMRDIYDRGQLGMVLIGMPGIEKRLSRYAQLYSRVGFVHHFKPLSAGELRLILEHKWRQLKLTLDHDDFTDNETVSAIVRVTGGNFCLLQRLFSQIERIMEINELHMVTKEVVETARESLVIGLS